MLPLVRRGWGFPHPLSLTQGATLLSRLLVYPRLKRRHIRVGAFPAYLLGRHAEEITLTLLYIEELLTELIDNRQINPIQRHDVVYPVEYQMVIAHDWRYRTTRRMCFLGGYGE